MNFFFFDEYITFICYVLFTCNNVTIINKWFVIFLSRTILLSICSVAWNFNWIICRIIKNFAEFWKKKLTNLISPYDNKITYNTFDLEILTFLSNSSNAYIYKEKKKKKKDLLILTNEMTNYPSSFFAERIKIKTRLK